jgi:signal transduction histidine kinase
MVAGFGGLLLLIVVIGFIGIQQILGLSRVVSHLAKTDIPRQNSVLEMKSNNSKYGMGIRSYMFWRGAQYLEAAGETAKLNAIRLSQSDFDRQLNLYEALATASLQKEWAKTLGLGQKELRKIGERIIALTGRMALGKPEAKKALDDEISRNLMDFENKLFLVDAFLDDPVQKYDLAEIDRQLAAAESGRQRSITFLSWSLFIGLLLGGQTARLIYRRSKNEQEHRELLWRRVIRVEEEERNNLSMQVHDQLGQDLSALKIYLGLIGRDIPADAKEQKEKIDKAKEILDQMMDKAHRISEMLRPPELDDLGLTESIAGLVLQHKEMTGSAINYQRPPEDLELSSEHNLVIYRIIQEALTNIAKHANARNVEVALERRDAYVYLDIADDGIGFDYAQYASTPQRRKEDRIKLGLQGLKERVELLGGRLTIDSRSDRGTKIEVVLPTT